MAKNLRANGPTDVKALRAASYQSGEKPGGAGRTSAFPAELRANVVIRNGGQFLHVEGYATIYNRGYTMWDMFGEYTEIAESGMLDLSLSRKPDVAFLTNHTGVTMARTTKASTLMLASDSTGLGVDAYLNLDRQDVRDLASAIGDELIDEMSFAFMIDDGEWSEDFDTFRLKQVDINRGDVSAVNYGANPYTSIGARAQTFMRSLEDMPPAIRAAAVSKIMATEDADLVMRSAVRLSRSANARYVRAAESPFADWDIEDLTGEDDEPDTDPDPEPTPEPAERGQDSAAMQRLHAMSLGNNDLPAEQSDGNTDKRSDENDDSVDVYARQWAYLTDES